MCNFLACSRVTCFISRLQLRKPSHDADLW
nr:MAG TPA: hypothetical protein [Caudoviricetes sp.]